MVLMLPPPQSITALCGWCFVRLINTVWNAEPGSPPGLKASQPCDQVESCHSGSSSIKGRNWTKWAPRPLPAHNIDSLKLNKWSHEEIHHWVAEQTWPLYPRMKHEGQTFTSSKDPFSHSWESFLLGTLPLITIIVSLKIDLSNKESTGMISGDWMLFSKQLGLSLSRNNVV